MAKLDIDFVLLDESVVMHGFRALMSGADLDNFIQNPVLLVLHNRSGLYTTSSEMVLPIGKWYDIRIEGDKLLAKPEFDDDDELAMKVQGKVEKGYMNGASVWIDPSQVSEEAKDMLPGQRLPTFTKWSLLEASIVDIPNCKNSLAIRNSVGKRITLSANGDQDLKEYINTFIKTNKISGMERNLLCAQLELPVTATDAEISEKLTAIKNTATTGASLATKNTELQNENTALKTAAVTKKITDLVDGAVDAKKLAAGQREVYIKLATADYDSTKTLIDAMLPTETIENKLAAAGLTDTDKLELEGLIKLSGHELYMSGKLENLKKLSMPYFKMKYKEALGLEHAGS